MCLSNFIGVLYIDVSCNNWRENVEVFFSFLFVLLYPYSVLNFMRAVLKLLKCTSILRFTLGFHIFLLLIWTCFTLNETDYWFWHLEEQVYPNYQCASVKALISVVEKLALWFLVRKWNKFLPKKLMSGPVNSHSLMSCMSMVIPWMPGNVIRAQT